jgi:hypothetical protein
LVVLRQGPVSQELIAVKFTPSQDQLELACGQSPVQNRSRLDVDQGLVLGVLGMKVSRLMIISVEGDLDAEEGADHGHGSLLA